ncbi:hypothetical protein [Microbacterium sp. RURRCA19A]|uniref:hypothetical protein n=1 Tax=Microbacterium sp. RURRCA19A TaxID=1907391 RepID=UPI0009568E40|nr:hypothetical protein [Microbacterium sp. RURRCA19A]SIR91276.1 hypothetical protein SAMN05880568_1768 [Microbacterium sp. RURRCA19A]
MSDRFLAVVPRSVVPRGSAPGATVARAVVPRATVARAAVARAVVPRAVVPGSGGFRGAADAALPHPALRAEFSGARHGRRSPQVQQEDTE